MTSTMVFGDVRLITAPAGTSCRFALEAQGLAVPALLVGAVPDLTDHLGSIASFAGTLYASGSNLRYPMVNVADLYLPQQPIEAPSHLFVVATGRLGAAPEANRKTNPDSYSASLCYANSDDADRKSSWVRVIARSFIGAHLPFSQLETGAAITVTGALESWQSAKGEPRCAISLKFLRRDAERSGYAAQVAPAKTLISSALPTEYQPLGFEDLPEQPALEPDDAFVGV